jgi:hypothetical protein
LNQQSHVNPVQDIPPAEAIMQALGFTPDDLSANQHGTLGAYQIAYLQTLQTRALLIGGAAFVAFALLAATFLFFGQQQNTIILTFAGIFCTLLNALTAGIFGRQWMRLAADIRHEQVEIIEGVMERVVRTEGRMNNFVLRVDGRQFAVKKELFRFFRHEAPYRLYRAAHSGTLLGAEPLS